MTGFLWRMAGALVVLTVGLLMMFYSLERLSLIRMAYSAGQGNGQFPVAVQVSLFIGLIAVNFSLFYALTRWADFLRDNPGTPQAPVWVLVAVLVVAGAVMVLAMASHAGYVRGLELIPTSAAWGYILFQVCAAAFALVALVLIAVRWSPGYRRRLGQV